MKTLHLTLSKEPFAVMVTGEKQQEFRDPSQWMISRMYKNGRIANYDFVKFTNGYGKDKPYFIAVYKDFYRENRATRHEWSTGFAVVSVPGDFVINIGQIIEKGNLNNQQNKL